MSENIEKFCNTYRQAMEQLTGVHKVEFIVSVAATGPACCDVLVLEGACVSILCNIFY